MKISTFLYTLFLSLTTGWLTLQPSQLLAQAYLLPTTGTASYTTCAGTLYDGGGPDDSYALDAKGSITFFPGTAGSKLKLEFTVLELDSVYASLTVYDGPDKNSPQIGRFYHGLPTVYATGSTGALTVALTANGGLPLRGFAAAISCAMSIPPPDLAVPMVQLVSTSALAGDLIRATSRIENLSGAHTSASLRYLLSTDTKPSPNDIGMGGTNDFLLTTGAWVPDEQLLPIPYDAAPGTYYLLCVVELARSPTAESNTANNVAYAPLTIVRRTPNVDLAVTDALYSSPYQCAPGTDVYPIIEIQNRGQTTSIASQTGFYLSADAVLSPDDPLLSTTLTRSLAVGEFSLAYGSVTIPLTTPTGTYYLLCAADYLDEVIEDNEQNNVVVMRLAVPPLTTDVGFAKDYTLAIDQPAPGSKVTIGCTLKNMGSIPLDSATIGYYLSNDKVLSADDVLLTHASSGALWLGNSSYGFIERTLTIPATTPLGKCYLLLVADYRNQLAERNEQNNILSLPLEVVVPDVDLAVSSASPYYPVAGNPLTFECFITNKGATTAYPAAVGYYLSTDNQLSTDDFLLGQTQSASLAGTGSQRLNNSLTTPLIIPARTVPGTYYLLCVADYLHQVAESNEMNNTLAVPLDVAKSRPDLTLLDGFEVSSARSAAGTEVKVSYFFTNVGGTPAYGSRVGFYLSTDSKIGPGDIYIGANSSAEWSAIYPGSSTYTTSNVLIPRSITPGYYYLLGVTDDLDELAETDETNNVRYAALEITATQPDLALQAGPYLSPKQAVAGSVVATESYVNNIGAGLVSASKVGYYLSSDPFLSPDDMVLGSAAVNGVRPGYSTIVPGSFTVPAATMGGRYYVLFVADQLNKLDDLDRSNNMGRATITITPQPLATREQTAGYNLRVSPVPAPQGNPVRVQFNGWGTRTEASLGLYNNLGQLLATQSLVLAPSKPNQAEISTAGLAAGVYILRITGPSLNAVRRVVIE